MQTSEVSDAALPADGRLNLNSEQLKSLRRKQGMSQEALSDACIERGLGLSLASVKRAESGKTVLYRTARHLAAFFGVTLEALTGTCDSALAKRGTAGQHAYERDQMRLAMMAVQASGCGRVTLLTGAAGCGTSPLLAAAGRDAHRSGFCCIALQAGADAAPIIAALAAALLGIELASASADTMRDAIGVRLRRLGLPSSYTAPCTAAVMGAPPLGLPDNQAGQLTALGALVRRVAQDRPLFISVDNVHCATPAGRTLLEQLLPWTLHCPVTWVLACNTGPAGWPASDWLLAAVPRMVLHLDPMQTQYGPRDSAQPFQESAAFTAASLYANSTPQRSDH